MEELEIILIGQDSRISTAYVGHLGKQEKTRRKGYSEKHRTQNGEKKDSGNISSQKKLPLQ